jgi:ER lumen protein retaining receptor
MKIVFLLSSCGIIYLMRFHKVIKVQESSSSRPVEVVHVQQHGRGITASPQCVHNLQVTYDKDQDTFRYQFLLIPCFVLALFLNNERTVLEVGCQDSSCDGAACLPGLASH